MTIEQPRLVLLPGMDGTGLLFASLLDVLGDSIPVQTIQYPADVCIYSQVLDHIASHVDSKQPHIVVAESFSSPAALLYAATNPSGLRAVVIVAGFSYSPLGFFISAFLRAFLSFLFLIPLPTLLVRLLLLDAGEEKVQWVQKIIRAVPASTLKRRLASILRVNVNTHVSVPMLYLRAQGDRLVTKRSVQIFRKRYPEAGVVELSGGHLLLQSNPVDAGKEIIRFKNFISEHPNRW